MAFDPPTTFGLDQFVALLRPNLRSQTSPDCARAAALHVFDTGPAEVRLDPTTHHTVAVTLHGVTNIEREADRSRAPARLETGNCTISPVGGARAWRWDGAVRVAQVYVPPETLESCAAAYGVPRGALLLHDTLAARDDFLRQVIVSTVREVRDGTPLTSLYVDTLAHSVAAHLLNRYCEPFHARPQEDGPGALRIVLEMLETEFASDLTLDTLARCAGMTRPGFLRAFKRQTGCTPHQYLLEKRVAVAAQMLRTSRIPIAEIAAALGFSDQPHFTRRFKQLMRVTPARYRAG